MLLDKLPGKAWEPEQTLLGITYAVLCAGNVYLFELGAMLCVKSLL